MERTIGLRGAVVTLTGFVIGASIFLLPGELAATAGPGVVVSYGIASVIVAFSCVIGAHIGTMFPVSGASFVYATRLTAPLWGFLMIWLTIAGVSMSVALVAHGFAGYFNVLFPGADRMLVAVLVVLVFGVINMRGAVASVRVQSLMVIAFMTAVTAFAVTGTAQVDTGLLIPVAPNGYGPVLAAAVPAVFSYAGFLVIIDIGGEIRNPSRTIPLALLISFMIVWLGYSSVSLAIVGHIPWQQLAGHGAPVVAVAQSIFPAWAAGLFTYAVLVGMATSINGLLLGYSRDVYVLARVRLLPGIIATTSRRNGQPHFAVALLTVASVLAVLIGARISEYARVVVMALMLAQVLLGVATLRLPAMPSARPAAGAFALSPSWRVFFAAGLIVVSTAFFFIGVLAAPRSALLLVLFALAGCAYYLARRHALKSRGVDMEAAVIQHIDAQACGQVSR